MTTQITAKPELSESEKTTETAFKFRQRIWMGYHERKTDDYKVEKLKAYLLEILEKWEAKQLSQLPNP